MGFFDGGIPPPKNPKHSFTGLRMPLRAYAIALRDLLSKEIDSFSSFNGILSFKP